MGVSRQLARTYKSHGWIKTFGHGAFVKPQDRIEWFGALYALQAQLGLPIYLGGRAALAWQGHAHFLPLGREMIDLFMPLHTHVPKWFLEHAWSENIRMIACSFLPPMMAIQALERGGLSFQVASRERAALELLALTPKKYTFEETNLIMASLQTLRPTVLTQLLAVCTSERAKRLLLYFGDIQGHAWRSDLNEKDFTFGKSLLKIATKNGHYESKYNLFLPQEYVVQDGPDIAF